jgi:uncharacterized repeat protein (TIGR01451 family)
LIFHEMKGLFRVRTLALALAAAGLLAVLPRAGAQGFGLSVSASASSLLVSNSLTYTINVTNLNAIPLVDTLVTNLLSAPFQFVGATGPQGTYTSSSSNVVFDLTSYFSGYFQVAQLTLTVRPTATGSITNAVTVGSITVTNITSTNLVVFVTNAMVQADLGVVLTGSTQPVITNDWMIYGVAVSNAGPSAATGVVLTNTLPPGVGFISVSPAGLAPAVADSNIVFNLGTLAAEAFTNLLLTVQPTNAGVLTFSSFVVSPNTTDTNAANNSASTNITVTGYLPGVLTVFTNSAQTTNFISGLLEQTITVSNAGPTPVVAARVVVAGLTNRLFNAVGTNGVSPFVVYDPPSGTTLSSGQSVNLLLQFFPRRAFPFTNSQMQAFEVPVPDWTPPSATAATTNINYTRLAALPNGNLLIEWTAISNRSYTVVYSDDDPLVSNGLIAPPTITAPANVVEWIDYGPPATTSKPASVTNRFYRIYLNP